MTRLLLALGAAGLLVFGWLSADTLAAGEPGLKGEVKDTKFESKHLGKARMVSVYLPPDHDAKKTYPVIYSADGFEGINVKSIEELITSKKIPPLIIVGTAHGGNLRAAEYIPNFRGEPKYFEAHEKFIIEEVMPWAEKEYGASKARTDQAIYGTSNSGPYALHMPNRHPDKFGKVIAMMVYGNPIQLFEKTLQVNEKEPTRYILVTGGNDKNGVRENQQVEEVLKARKLPVSSKIVPGGGHTRKLQQEELPACVEALFGMQKKEEVRPTDK